MAHKTPKFLRVLYDILHIESPAILAWSPCGAFFQVYDITRLEQDVLPRYFKHSKFASFQRQLNNFGFRKWTKTRASVCTFSHDSLVQCAPMDLPEMVAKSGIVSPHTKTTPTAGKRARSDSDTTESGSDCDLLVHFDPKKLKASDEKDVATGAEQESLLALLDCAFDIESHDDILMSLDLASENCGEVDWLFSNDQDELVEMFDELFDAASTLEADEWSQLTI